MYRQMAIPTEMLVGRIANGMVIRVVGRGTMHESYAFRAVVESNLENGGVVFDATQCEYLDSTFLGCLISIRKACEQSANGEFIIAASASTRIKLFSTSCLDQYFDFVDACPEPIHALALIDVEALDRETLGRHVMGCHERLAERGGEKRPYSAQLPTSCAKSSATRQPGKIARHVGSSGFSRLGQAA
jgi:anti-anti-sigma regulatory factor